jgi:hypothetical protein
MGREHLKDLDIVERIILEWIFRKNKMWDFGLDLHGSGNIPALGCC